MWWDLEGTLRPRGGDGARLPGDPTVCSLDARGSVEATSLRRPEDPPSAFFQSKQIHGSSLETVRHRHAGTWGFLLRAPREVTLQTGTSGQ